MSPRRLCPVLRLARAWATAAAPISVHWAGADVSRSGRPVHRRERFSSMNIPHTQHVIVVAAAAFGACVAFAQTTVPGSDSVRGNEAVILSPFEVKDDIDTGYLATSAQSGTRLRTDLKDI